MFDCRFDPETHLVGETPFGKFLRDHFGDPLLFTYQHRVTGNWMVAAWTDATKQRMQELAIMGKAPVGNRGIVESIETMVRGNPEGEWMKRENKVSLAQAKKRLAAVERDEQNEYHDAMSFLARYGCKGVKHPKHFVVNG
jgi:hypothetical protein